MKQLEKTCHVCGSTLKIETKKRNQVKFYRMYCEDCKRTTSLRTSKHKMYRDWSKGRIYDFPNVIGIQPN